MSGVSYVGRTPKPSHSPRLALVLWSGRVGGAETLNVSLAKHLRQLGADVTIVFIENPWPLGKRLSSAGVPYTGLGFSRGRAVLRHPRRYAAMVASVGPDGALLLECGFIGAALRAGGYHGSIVAVEHGALLGLQRVSKPRRLLWKIGRFSGALADDAEVAVSDFMLDRMRRHSHTRRLRRIYNGIDLDMYLPAACPPTDRSTSLVVGFAGRLIPGKGADHLIQAIAHADVKLLIAGDGPERTRLTSLAEDLGATSKIAFLESVDDIPQFWRQCDVAVLPSDAFIESFSMATLEAMACGKPIVATRNGAIPELMTDGVTGTLVAPGDIAALAKALAVYAESPNLRSAHGAAARARAIAQFNIEDSARAYLDLFDELATKRQNAKATRSTT
jgi:glycosyltransferase involved in cell wall biosynthesis